MKHKPIFALVISVGVMIASCSRENPSSADVKHEAPPLKPIEAREQGVGEVRDWCTRGNDGMPETCACGVESPHWIADQARSKGHRVSMHLERDGNGNIQQVTVEDYFMPNNGDVFSGFSNKHVYYSSIASCRGLTSSPPQAECLGYSSSVELRGMLRSETFPGPPNYESVAAGDRAEAYFFVAPTSPVCIRQGDASGLEPAAADVGRVQLIFFNSSAYDKLRPSLGKEVYCTGKLMGAHTGHHHSAVLLTNSECNAAQPIIPPDATR